MTNLQAMQDEWLRELIHDVELLEKLHTQVADMKYNYDYSTGIQELSSEIKYSRVLVLERWKELMEVAHE